MARDAVATATEQITQGVIFRMFSYPPFKNAASAFTATEVASGVELVVPTHGHANTVEATRARNFYFKMALHPFSMHIFDQAANGNSEEYFRTSAKRRLKSLKDYIDAMTRTHSVAQEFEPVRVGREWSIYKDSFLVRSTSCWPEASRRAQAITDMLEEYGMLQDDTADNEAGVCDTRYTQMATDLGTLIKLLKRELAKGMTAQAHHLYRISSRAASHFAMRRYRLPRDVQQGADVRGNQDRA